MEKKEDSVAPDPEVPCVSRESTRPHGGCYVARCQFRFYDLARLAYTQTEMLAVGKRVYPRKSAYSQISRSVNLWLAND